MRGRLIQKDLVRNKVVSLIVLFFIAITAMLLSLVSALSVHLFGSIDVLMQQAKTPHFMQMHSGAFDQSKLERFAAKTEGVEEVQVLSFLGIDSEKIIVNGKSLVGTLQDNGFCIQSKAFDFLLDFDGKPVYPAEGELYAPVFYSKDGTIQTGDTVVIGDTSFTVAGFVRDSQMNSALAYSKRFVVSPADYAKLEPLGAVEALIEFRLTDTENLGCFEAAYSKAQLPANGPMLTWPLFRMISAMSDGMMLAVILLVSILVILIALLCIRFTLLAKIEDDYKEIGTMKAIGIRLSEIRGIYLSTYGVLAAAGCVLGFALSLIFYEPMLKGIRLNFGDSGRSSMAFLLGIFCILLLFCFILLYVHLNLRRFRRFSAAEAIRCGIGETSGRHSHLKLSKNKRLSTNLFLGISDVLARKRLYATMLVVVMLSAFIIIVPQNLYHTISSENFVTYMGIGRCDLRMDIQQNSDITGKTRQIAEIVAADADVAAWSIVCVSFFDPSQTNSKLAQYGEQFDFARVSGIDDYISQTFGQTLRSVRTASLVSVGVAVAVTLLVTLLFLKLLIAKDAYSIAIIKAIGYTTDDLKRQFACRMLSVLAVGIVLGTTLAGTLGEKIAAMAISSFGAAAFRFEVNLPVTFILCPMVLLLGAMAAVMIGTDKIGQISISKAMKE